MYQDEILEELDDPEAFDEDFGFEPYGDVPDLSPGFLDEDGEDLAEREALEREDLQREIRIAAGFEHRCRVCGCSESEPPSSRPLIWADKDLCSGCYAKAQNALARKHAAAGGGRSHA